MARKIKQGLDYFPHNCSYDDELKYIIAVHKCEGYTVYFELLRKIYSDLGYYMKADKKVLALFANEINVNIERINVIINDCLSEHLFDKYIHKSHEILTSKGIQERYFDAIKRRKEIDLINDYILIENVDNLLINVNINWLNVDKSTQSRVEKSRVEKSIQNDDFLLFWEKYHNITGLTKTDKDAALKYWKKLKDDEKQKAINNIELYFDSLSDKKYCKKARTYLADKNFNDEFKINKQFIPGIGYM